MRERKSGPSRKARHSPREGAGEDRTGEEAEDIREELRSGAKLLTYPLDFRERPLDVH